MKLKIESYKLLLFTVTVSYSTSFPISSLISSFLLLSALLLTEAERAIGWSPDQTRPTCYLAGPTDDKMNKKDRSRYVYTDCIESVYYSAISNNVYDLSSSSSLSSKIFLSWCTVNSPYYLTWPILPYPTAADDTVHNRSVRWINTL